MVTIKRKIVTEIEWKVSVDDISWNAFDAWLLVAQPKTYDPHDFEQFVRENIGHIMNMDCITRKLGYTYDDIVGDYDDELVSVAMENNDYFFKEKYIEERIDCLNDTSCYYRFNILREFGVETKD